MLAGGSDSKEATVPREMTRLRALFILKTPRSFLGNWMDFQVAGCTVSGTYSDLARFSLSSK